MIPDNPQTSGNCPKCGSGDLHVKALSGLVSCAECSYQWSAVKSTQQQDRTAVIPLKIFLSYGHDEHVEAALRIKADLEARGHSVWFDLDRLRVGVDWESYIEEGLQWCDKVILLMTPHSVRRRNLQDPDSRDGFCLNELAKADALNKRIIPILLVEVESGPPLKICRIQYLDLRDAIPIAEREDRYRSKFERLVLALEEDDLDFEGGQTDLKRRLKPIDFRGDWSQHLAHFHGREWLLKHIRNWLAEETGSPVFWLTASPGVGKTAFSAFLSNHMAEVVGCHFFVAANDEKCDPRRLVMSLAYQLSQSLPGFDRYLQEHHREDSAEYNAATLFDNLIIAPLSSGLPQPKGPRLIILDGLDEASQDGRNKIAELIRDRWSKTPRWLRLLITSRPQEKELRAIQWAFQPYELAAETAENLDDLRSFFKSHLCESGQEKIVQELVARSQGVFLYAAVVLGELQAGRLKLDDIESFPRGMAGYYAQYFTRQFPDVEIYKRSIRPLLSLILAQRERLPCLLLSQVSGVASETLLEHLAALGSLFPVRGQDAASQTIAPFHKSLVDWLTTADQHGLPIAEPYAVDVQAGKLRLAEYLGQRWLADTPPIIVPIIDETVGYELRQVVGHLCDVDRLDDACRLLTDFDFVETRCRKDHIIGLFEDYALLLRGLPEAAAEEREKQLAESALTEYGVALYKHANDPARYAMPEPLELIDLNAHRTPKHQSTSWSRPDRLRAWRDFLMRHRTEISEWQESGYIPFASALFSTAWNSADRGPIVESLEKRSAVQGFADNLPWLRMVNRSPFHIQPLCLESHDSDEDGSVVWSRLGGTRMLLANIHPDDESEPSMGAVTRLQLDVANLTIYSREIEFECPVLVEEDESPIVSLALSGTGSWGVIGRKNGIASVWNLDSLRLVMRPSNHAGDGVTAAWISADGESVITGDGSEESGSVNIWSTSEARWVSGCALSGRVNALDVTADSTWVLVGLRQTSFAAKLLHVVQGHWDQIDWPGALDIQDVKAVSITPNGRRLAVVDHADLLTIWDRELELDFSTENTECIDQLGPPRLVRAIDCSGDEIYQLQLLPDGGTCVSIGRRRVAHFNLRSASASLPKRESLPSIGLVTVGSSGEFVGHTKISEPDTLEETTELCLSHLVRGLIRQEAVPPTPRSPVPADTTLTTSAPDHVSFESFRQTKISGLAMSIWGKLVARSDGDQREKTDGYRLFLVSPDMTRAPIALPQKSFSTSGTDAYWFKGPDMHPDGQTVIVNTIHQTGQFVDGKHVIFQDRSCDRWHLLTGAQTLFDFDPLQIHCFSSDGAILFVSTASMLEQFVAIDWRSGLRLWSRDTPVYSCRPCADPRYIILQIESERLQICDATTGKVLHTGYGLFDSMVALLDYGLTPNLTHWIIVTSSEMFLQELRSDEYVYDWARPRGTKIVAASIGGATIALVVASDVTDSPRTLELWRIEGLFGKAKPPTCVVAFRSCLPEDEPPFPPPATTTEGRNDPADSTVTPEIQESNLESCHMPAMDIENVAEWGDSGISLDDDDMFSLDEFTVPQQPSLRIVCPSCFHKAPISDDLLRKNVACPKCETQLSIFLRAGTDSDENQE